MTIPEDVRARAQDLVVLARDGAFGQDGHDLVALMLTAFGRAQDAETMAKADRERRQGIEREANALAAVVADMLDGARPDDVVDDLPHDARRRVIAYRHQSSPLRRIPPMDQFGPLPKVPPRASVMRDRTRIIDQEDNPL